MWALVLALIPLPPLWVGTLVLSIIVLTRPDDGRRRGKGIAVTALVVLPLWILVFVGVAFVLAAADHVGRDDATGVVNIGGRADFEDVRAGDCAAELPDEPGYGLDLVPCWDLHLYEVLGSFDLAAGSYPGEDVVDSRAEAGCADLFADRRGISYDDSDLEMQYFSPLAETWQDDRSVVCVIYAADLEPRKGTYPDASVD